MNKKIIFGTIFLYTFFLYCSTSSPQKAPIQEVEKPEVKIVNIKDGDIIQSGFLVGSVPSDVYTKVEVGSEKDPFKPAEVSGGYWKFKLPTVKDGWKQGDARTFTVRALDKNGNHSLGVKVTIRHGVNRDLNGDGFPDLVMGDHLYDNTKGAAFVYHGSQQGIQVNVEGKKASKILKGKVGGQHFAKTIVIEDFDQDGFADVIISNLHKDSNIQAYIYKGSAEGIDAPVVKTVLSNQNRSGYFGISFLVGDLNLKGFFKLFVHHKDKDKKAKKETVIDVTDK